MSVNLLVDILMPKLSDTLHLDMLKDASKNKNASLYGLHWGDPNKNMNLKFIRDNYLYRYLNPEHTALEIGPGGGRWTRYLLSFDKVYAVDYHQELLDELERNFVVPHLHTIKNNGTDFPGIESNSIDFIFSFGVFVHLDREIIDDYLRNMKSILKQGGNIVIQYSDKTKKLAQANPGFSVNNPTMMRKMVLSHGYTILEENLTILKHSSIMRFTLPST